MDREDLIYMIRDGATIPQAHAIIDYIDRLEQENRQLKSDYGNKAQVERDMLLKQNQQLKEDYNKVVHESTEFESKVYDLQKEIKQLKEQLEKKYSKVGTLTSEILYEENTKLLSILDEIREIINQNMSSYYDFTKAFYEIENILDKAKEC